MWQRFTERARATVFYAQEEAQKRNQKLVTSEHLFLGALHEGSLACHLLTESGCRVEDIKQSLAIGLPVENNPYRQDCELSRDAKRAIDAAYEEARRFNHNYIGTEHLLLGTLLQNSPTLHEVLIPYDFSLETLREKIAIVAPPQKNLSIREKIDKLRQFLSRWIR